MTIKEKFALILMEFWSSDWESKCEQEADEFAIGFAEWLYRYDNTRLPNGNWIIKLGLKPYTSEEVLEIYKKEKEL
jgi:hypothetical protein